MSLPSMNFLHLTVSEIQLGQTISRCPPAHPDTMGENNTPTALKGCGVKTGVVDLKRWVAQSVSGMGSGSKFQVYCMLVKWNSVVGCRWTKAYTRV